MHVCLIGVMVLCFVGIVLLDTVEMSLCASLVLSCFMTVTTAVLSYSVF